MYARAPVLSDIGEALALSVGLAVDRATRFNDTMYERAHSSGLPQPFILLYRHVRYYRFFRRFEGFLLAGIAALDKLCYFALKRKIA